MAPGARRRASGSRSAAILLLALAACDRGGPEPRPVPVILVSLDTCRADRLVPFGGQDAPGTALAALLPESVVFTDCLAQSSNTGPSHRTVFTGQFPHRHGQRERDALHTPYTLAGLLAAAGWETAAFTGGGMLHPAMGLDQGFGTYRYENERGRRRARRGFRGVLPQARRWLEAREAAGRGSEPFFLFLHTYDIHCPYWPSADYRQRFGGTYEGPMDLRRLCGPAAFAPFFGQDGRLSAVEERHLRGMYDGGVAMATDLLGTFLEELRAQGVLDRALLVVFSDHGESLGEHGLVGHNAMWEEQLRVPLLVRFPGGEFGGTVCREPVMLADLLPTILDVVGLPVPAGVQGESLLPVLRGERSWPEGRLRLAEFGSWTSFRFDGRWKVVLEEPEGGGEGVARLYDLLEDPEESRDLAGTPEGGERLAVLLGRWRRFREETREEDARWRGVPYEAPPDPELEARLEELGYGGG